MNRRGGVIAVSVLAAVLLAIGVWRSIEAVPQPEEGVEEEASALEAPAPASATALPPLMEVADLPAAEMELTGPGGIRVTVLDREGAPVQNAEIVLLHWPGDPAASDPAPLISRQADADGRTSFIGLEVGRYAVEARHGDSAASWQGVLSPRNLFQNLRLVAGPTGAMSGVVVTGLGRPAGGALVECFAEFGAIPVARMHCGKEGAFAFDGLALANYRVAATLDGYGKIITPPVPAGTENLRILLLPLSEIRLRALLESSLQPLPDVALLLIHREFEAWRHQLRTDDRGMAVFEQAASGTWLVQIADSRFVTAPVVTEVSVSAGERQQVDIICGRSAAVSGRVVDEDSGMGVPGVIVSATDWPHQRVSVAADPTSGAGSYEVMGLPAGNCRIWVSGPQEDAWWPVGPVEVSLQAGITVAAPDLLLRGGETLAGRVIDQAGNGYPGATVRAQARSGQGWGLTRATSTDIEGFFVLRNVMNSARTTETARLREPELEAERRPVYVWAEAEAARSEMLGPIDLDADVPAELVLRLQPEDTMCAISGIVVDQSNTPVQARVSARKLEERAHSATSGLDGHFLIAGLTPGTYALALGRYMPGAFTEMHQAAGEVVVGASKPRITGMRLVLQDGGASIRGRLLDVAGNPVSRHGLTLAQQTDLERIEDYAETFTGSDGSFQFLNVDPGGLYEVWGVTVSGRRWMQPIHPDVEQDIVLPEAPTANYSRSRAFASEAEE